MKSLLEELNEEKYGLSPKKVISIIDDLNRFEVSTSLALQILKNEGINKLEIYLVKMEFNKRKVS